MAYKARGDLEEGECFVGAAVSLSVLCRAAGECLVLLDADGCSVMCCQVLYCQAEGQRVLVCCEAESECTAFCCHGVGLRMKPMICRGLRVSGGAQWLPTQPPPLSMLPSQWYGTVRLS